MARGLLPGLAVEAADATQAYVQSNFVGTETWVILPEDQVPDKYKHTMTKPVFKLKRAPYGHPDSGGFWEQHCEKQVFSAGFQRIPEWQSCFYHPIHRTFLVIYVDDFLMSGPQAGLNACWKAIRCATANHPGIDMENPKTVSRYLGCDHMFCTAKCPISGKPVSFP